MTIKDVIKISATLLGRENVIDYIDNGNETDAETLTTVDNLTRCANLVISELAFSVVPMIKSEKVIVKNGKVEFDAFSEKVISVLSASSENGNPVRYKTYLDKIELAEPSAVIEYRYLPANYGLEETIGYKDTDLSAEALAFGTLAEFLLIERAFDESVMWRERFTETISIQRAPKNKTVKGRVWM